MLYVVADMHGNPELIDHLTRRVIPGMKAEDVLIINGDGAGVRSEEINQLVGLFYDAQMIRRMFDGQNDNQMVYRDDGWNRLWAWLKERGYESDFDNQLKRKLQKTENSADFLLTLAANDPKIKRRLLIDEWRGDHYKTLPNNASDGGVLMGGVHRNTMALLAEAAYRKGVMIVYVPGNADRSLFDLKSDVPLAGELVKIGGDTRIKMLRVRDILKTTLLFQRFRDQGENGVHYLGTAQTLGRYWDSVSRGKRWILESTQWEIYRAQMYGPEGMQENCFMDRQFCDGLDRQREFRTDGMVVGLIPQHVLEWMRMGCGVETLVPETAARVVIAHYPPLAALKDFIWQFPFSAYISRQDLEENTQWTEEAIMRMSNKLPSDEEITVFCGHYHPAIPHGLTDDIPESVEVKIRLQNGRRAKVIWQRPGAVQKVEL